MKVERITGAEEEVRAVSAFLIPFHNEAGLGQVDVPKALAGIYAIIQGVGAWAVRSEGGELLGAIGLYKSDLWYGPSFVLTDRWFYVRPDDRGAGAGSLLLETAAEEAERRGLPLIIARTNALYAATKRRRGILAGRFMFVPLGAVLRIR